MSEIFISLLLILFAFGFYTIWLKPMRTMKFYAKFLRDKGYKVLELPYNPAKNHLADMLDKGTKQGDAMKAYKDLGSQYDVVISNMLTKPLLQFYSPEFIKDFYSVDKHYQYPKQKKVVDIFSRAAGHGLPFSEGANWKRKRTIFNKVFNFQFVKSQSSKIRDICSGAIAVMESRGQKGPEQNAVTYNILDLTVQMFSAVTMESFLGGSKNQVIMGQPAGLFLKKLLDDLGKQSFAPINLILGSKFLSLGVTNSQREIQNRVQAYRKWGVQFIRKRVVQIDQKIKNNPDKKDPEDIIEAIVRARNAKNDGEEIISTEEEMFQEFNAFFVAGTDTTSNFTQSMIYAIANNPEIEKKLREEINTYMKSEDYSYENLKNLKYIDQIQKQVTRFYGPATLLFVRVAMADNYLNGVPIRKGTSVQIMHFGNHFSTEYFKNPYEFRPERWDSECNDLPPFITGGFSAGARTCIGKHLAMLENKIAIVKFMKRYKQIILPKKDFKMEYKFVYGPEQFDTKMIIDQDYEL